MCSRLWSPVSVASRLRLKLNIDKEFFPHFKIFEVAIVGVYDKKWVKLGKAFIRLKQGKTVTLEEVFSYLKKKISLDKTPKHIEIIDKLPKMASGKIKKDELAK